MRSVRDLPQAHPDPTMTDPYRQSTRHRRVCALGALWMLTGVCLGAWQPLAHAEKKNAPGIFDFQTWKTPKGHQQDAVKDLAPVRLDQTPAQAWSGEPQVMRLRIYADKDYRTTVLHWQSGIRVQIERANRVLAPVFHVRFEIESLRPWERSHVGMPFDPILTEIEALDPAQDVDWVMGLITPFRGIATSMHQIGGSHLLARHFVLRGMDDAQESLALDREFNLLDPEQRQRVYLERKGHKETVVLLHEWAHALGSLHNEDAAAIMHPAYDAQRSTFSDFEKELIAFVLERRLSAPAERYPESAGLPAVMERMPTDEGSDKERASLLAFVRERARGGSSSSNLGGAGSAAGKSNDSVRGRVQLDLPAAYSASYSRVVAALNARHPDEAWAELLPLARKYPKHVLVSGLACPLVAGHPAADDARAVCEVALVAKPPRLEPVLDAAGAYANAQDWARATPLVFLAGTRVAQSDRKLRLRLANLAAGAGALTLADSVLSDAERRDPEVLKLWGELETQRMQLALPRGVAACVVPAEQEPAYRMAFLDLAKTVSTEKTSLMRPRIQAFRTAYPGCAGPDVLECEVELAAHHMPVASKLCEAALAKDRNATRAHYLLGFIAGRSGRTDVAEKHLHKVILLDPSDLVAWQELARLYRTTHARQRLSDLESQYQALMSKPLPEK